MLPVGSKFNGGIHKFMMAGAGPNMILTGQIELVKLIKYGPNSTRYVRNMRPHIIAYSPAPKICVKPNGKKIK